MAITKVVYTMSGPHKGKDFTPKNHAQFVFVKGVLEMSVDPASIGALDRILGGYGASRDVVADKPAAKKPAAKKTTTAKKPAAKTKAAETKAGGDDADTEKEGAKDDSVQSAGDTAKGGSTDGGSDDDTDAGQTGDATEQPNGDGSTNDEAMI